MYKFDFMKEHIHGNRFKDVCTMICDPRGPSDKQKQRLYEEDCIIFCKPKRLSELFDATINSSRRHVLISHNGDKTINKDICIRKPKCIRHWFALNCQVVGKDITPIPSGVERPGGGGYSSDMAILKRQLEKPREVRNLLYLNHNIKTNAAMRGPITEYLKDRPWVTYREYGVGFEEYIRNLHSHPFVLSFPGNGIDCHRTWEALYMGSFPVCFMAPPITYFAIKLPIVVTDSKDALKRDVLVNTLAAMAERQYDYSFLKISYWKKLIRDTFKEKCE